MSRGKGGKRGGRTVIGRGNSLKGRPPGLHEDLKAAQPGPWKEEEEGKEGVRKNNKETVLQFTPQHTEHKECYSFYFTKFR